MGVLDARIDVLIREGEIRNNELRDMAIFFGLTSAKCKVQFEESHTHHAEALTICRNNNERCNQLEELVQCLKSSLLDARIKDLPSRLEAQYIDRKEKLEDSEQADVPHQK